MDREGVKSIATMRKGKGVMIKPARAPGAMPGGPIPQATPAQLQERARAKQAYQSERVTYPGTDMTDISNIVQERRGPLLARREARGIDFDRVAAQRRNVENLMHQHNKYVTQRTVTSAHQEMEQLGNTLGSAYKELHPLQRDAIESRAQQLRELVRTQDPDHVLEAGRRRQRAYMQHNQMEARRARERQFHRERLPSRAGTEHGDDAGYVPARIRAGIGHPMSEGGDPRLAGAGFLELVR